MSNRNLSVPANLDITFVRGDAEAIAARARQAAKGKNVWLFGGGKTAACFADAGELQQLFITTIPVFLGTGVPVLPVDRALEVILRKQRTLHSGAIECILDVKADDGVKTPSPQLQSHFNPPKTDPDCSSGAAPSPLEPHRDPGA